MARLTKKAINAFKGRQAEETVYGEEPAKLGAAFEFTRGNMMAALNWYSCLKDVKEMRKYVERYAATRTKQITPKVAASIKQVKDAEISITMCAMAKMHLAACPLPVSELKWLDGRINEIAGKVVEQKQEEVVKVKTVENQLIADTEDLLDEFYRSDYKKEPVDFYKFLEERAPSATQIRTLLTYYTPLVEEIVVRDDLTKKQKKAYDSFVQKILEESEKYLNNQTKEKKLTRKPRQVKAKSADKVVKNVRYKQTDPALKLVSAPPTQLHGAKTIWLYNTKTKRLTYLEASEPMTVKGTTVVGFDEKLSSTKTLRKPAQTFSEMLNTTSARMLKVFKALSTKPSAANGRLNADTIIVKAGK